MAWGYYWLGDIKVKTFSVECTKPPPEACCLDFSGKNPKGGGFLLGSCHWEGELFVFEKDNRSCCWSTLIRNKSTNFLGSLPIVFADGLGLYLQWCVAQGLGQSMQGCLSTRAIWSIRISSKDSFNICVGFQEWGWVGHTGAPLGANCGQVNGWRTLRSVDFRKQ